MGSVALLAAAPILLLVLHSSLILFRRRPKITHTVTVSPAAAAWAKRLAEHRGTTIKKFCFALYRSDEGKLLLVPHDKTSVFEGGEYAIATSNGVNVVVPEKLVEEYPGLVIDYQFGRGTFSGPGAPMKGSAMAGGMY
jgi:hypothetical protein